MPRDISKFVAQNFSPRAIPSVDLQMHTNWTHGADSVRVMYEAAVAAGLRQVCFTEHVSERSDEWFSKFVQEVRALPSIPCHAAVGAEARVIDRQGNLGCSKEIISQCDLVLGSVHRFPDSKGGVKAFEDIARENAEALEFEYAMALLDNPVVDILAHPFGMCYKRYNVAPSKEHMYALIEKAAKTKTAFEINGYYHPDPWQLIAWCRQVGASMSLGSDAHSKREVGAIVTILAGGTFVWNR